MKELQSQKKQTKPKEEEPDSSENSIFEGAEKQKTTRKKRGKKRDPINDSVLADEKPMPIITSPLKEHNNSNNDGTTTSIESLNLEL